MPRPWGKNAAFLTALARLGSCGVCGGGAIQTLLLMLVVMGTISDLFFDPLTTATPNHFRGISRFTVTLEGGAHLTPCRVHPTTASARLGLMFNGGARYRDY